MADPAGTPDGEQSAAKLVAQALAAHRQGRLAEAVSSYRQALEQAPAHFDALHLLGVALAQRSDYPAAIALLSRAVQARPNAAIAYCNLGNAQRDGGHPQDAMVSFDHALRINPAEVNALCGRARALQQLNRQAEALDSCDAALRIEARRFDAHYFRGNSLARLGRLPEAVAAYDRAIQLNPVLWEALFERGTALLDLKRLEPALASFDAALRLRPDDAGTLNNRGIVLRALGRLPQALSSFDRAVQVAPDFVDAYNNRGNLLQDLKRLTEALADQDRAVQIAPENPDLHCNRGAVLQQLGRLPEALASYDRALLIAPEHAEAHANRGNALQELGQPVQALACFERAIQIKPDYAEAHAYAGLCRLLLGDLRAGWAGFEWRWRTAALQRTRPDFAAPFWDGVESLKDKSILLWADQGAGDCIQFCRFIPMLARREARVLLLANADLRGILAGLPGIRRLLQPGDSLPRADYQLPLLSLPRALGIDQTSIPAQPGYLRADPERVAAWATRLGSRRRPRIGLAWSGNPTHSNDRNRSIPLQQFSRLCGGEFEFVCIQKEIRDADRPVLAERPDMRQFCSELTGYEETAALLQQMDLVISVDTSVAHLSGALGRPLWILLPFVPDWRWLLEREDSPWYPTARLFRQPRHGDWESVLEQVSQALAGNDFDAAVVPPAVPLISR